METRVVSVGTDEGAWQSTVCSQADLFAAEMIGEGQETLALWQRLFPHEHTWVQEEHGVPSLIVRLDCTICADGHLGIYEVEERPAGIGFTGLLNAQFQSKLAALRQKWPSISVVLSPNRRAGDDYLWTEVVSEVSNGHKVLVRAEPEESDYWPLEGRSISSVRSKGDKSYGVAFGWWREVNSTNDLPWDETFVLKPMQGSKARGIAIWDPQRRNGASTRSQVERARAAAGGRVFLQPFIPALAGREGYAFKMLRMFYGYDPELHFWQCLGGSWTARNNLRLHGSSDSLFGPVLVP